MPYTLTSDDNLLKLARARAAKARDLAPATRKFMEFVARKARRDAPVGRGRNRGALRRSLNVRLEAHGVGVLQSPLAYARIQEEGGKITAGTGPLGSRLLAIPLNDEARRMLDGMGASVSLRSQDLVLVKTRRGRMVLIRPLPERGKRAKAKRGSKRQHRMFDGQVLFVLVPRVTIKAKHYAPRMSDPDVRAFGAEVLRHHLSGE